MREVLVITALQEEMDAVLELMPNGRADWQQHKIDEGYFYFEQEVENGGETFRLKVTSQAQPGPTYATAHTTLMLKSRPDILFMTGICAGNQAEGLELGDVVISDMAFHYETGKHYETEFKPEIENANVDPVIVQWLKDYVAENKGFLAVDGTTRNLFVGAFATEASVVSRTTIFSDLQKRERKVLALDMEAYSLLKAVEISNQKIPAIVIKGVCDFADPDKDDKAHALAAKVAAVCTLEVAKTLLSNLPPNASSPKATTITYPIRLPRPARNYGDRLKWRALLNWPDTENWHFGWGKDLETGTYDETLEFSGLEFYEVGQNKWLLEVVVGYGAYNGTYRYYLLDETGAENTWSELRFRTLYWSENDEIFEAMSPEVDGNAWFDPETNRIETFYKGRGVGDIGSLISYELIDGETRLLEYRHNNDWPDQFDESYSPVAPEDWPLIAIDRTFPKWSGAI